MKKDIEEIKIILAEIQQRIMYIEECQRRQRQVKVKDKVRRSKEWKELRINIQEEYGNTDPVTLRREL